MSIKIVRCLKCGGDGKSWSGTGHYVGRCGSCDGTGSIATRAEVSCAAMVGDDGGAPDANVQSVRRKMLIRAERGLDKYGVTTERTDLDTLQWLQHAQEEAMDLAVYLERLISDLKAALNTPTDQAQVSREENL